MYLFLAGRLIPGGMTTYATGGNRSSQDESASLVNSHLANISLSYFSPNIDIFAISSCCFILSAQLRPYSLSFTLLNILTLISYKASVIDDTQHHSTPRGEQTLCHNETSADQVQYRTPDPVLHFPRILSRLDIVEYRHARRGVSPPAQKTRRTEISSFATFEAVRSMLELHETYLPASDVR